MTFRKSFYPGTNLMVLLCGHVVAGATLCIRIPDVDP